MKFITAIALVFASVSTWAQSDAKPAKIPMTLIWTQISGADSYSVMISRTPHFHQSRAFKVKRTFMPVEVEPQGKYYWVVVALDTNDNEISDKVVVAFNPKRKAKSWTQLNPKDEPMEKTRMSADDYENFDPSKETLTSAPETSSAGLSSDHQRVLGLQVGVELAGGNLSFKQRHPSLTDMDSDGLMFPSIGLSLQTPKFFERFFAKFFLQQNIADFDTDTAGITLSDSSFRWLSYSASVHADFSSGNWTYTPYLAIQKMNTPFFVTNGTNLEIKDVEYINGGAGLKFAYSSDPKSWMYALDLSYLTELSSDSNDFATFESGSTSIVSAELSASLALSQILRLHFFGQLQQMDFQEAVATNGLTSDGKREALYYGLGSRITVSF